MRLRKDAQALHKLNNFSHYVSLLPIVVNDNWVIELAMGKGEMITQLAAKNVHKFYLGIEKEATVALKALKRAAILNLTNFYVICHDIKYLSTLVVGQVKELWLTFPDPWPKNYHQKRRLTSETFLKLYQARLAKDGVLKFKTDNDQLFNWTIKLLQENKWTISYLTNDLHCDIKNNHNIMTGYEIKWANKGKNINYLEARF